MPSHKRKQQPNQPKGDKNNKKLKNNSISKTNSMNYVIEHPPYLNRFGHQQSLTAIYDDHTNNDDTDNDQLNKIWFCDISIITIQHSTSSSQQVFMKRIVFPLPKRVPLRINFSPKNTISSSKLMGCLGINIRNQLLFVLDGIRFIAIIDLQQKKIITRLTCRHLSTRFKICENDNSLLIPFNNQFHKYRYNVPKILACQKQELQHVWSFKTSPDVMLGHSVVDIYDDQIDHHGSGVIYISAKDYILVLNGHDGQLLKKIGSLLFHGGHGAGMNLVLDGNRNLLACEYKRTHKLITKDGQMIMKINRLPNHYVKDILNDPSSNNLIVVYEHKRSGCTLMEIWRPNGELVAQRNIDDVEVDGICFNERTGELFISNGYSLTIFQ